MAQASAKVRPMIMAASAAALAATGAWYGANLKQDQEINKEVRRKREATPAEMIAILEQTRTGLVAKKVALEKKIAQLDARSVDQKEHKTALGSGEVKGRSF